MTAAPRTRIDVCSIGIASDGSSLGNCSNGLDGIQISADQPSILFAQPMIVAGEGTSPLILLVLS